MAKTNKGKQTDDVKECTYHVQGMHCPSCELLIEKELLKNEAVESVEASVGSGQVVIFYQNRKPSVNQLNQVFKNNGYTFFTEPVVKKKDSSFLSFNKQGQVLINKSKLFRYTQILGMALFLIVGFVFLSRSGVASRVVVSSSSALPAFFLFGLMAGVSSCAALVGGIVLSMSKQWSEVYRTKDSAWQKVQPHLLFNAGRLLSFALLGALLGTLGVFLQISLTAASLLAIVVSVIMVFLALQMLGAKRFQKFQITMPKSISRFVADETNFKGRYMPFGLGALTFFLPCGFTITAQGLALASGSGLRGSLIMASFALGTLPMLATIGFSALKLTAKPHLSDQFLKVAGVLVLFFGLYNFNSQLNVLGLPSLDDLNLNPNKAAEAFGNGLVPIVNGKQVIKMDALAYGYEPNEFKIRAGIPTRWEINNQGVSGCTNAIVSKGLFSGEVRIDKNFVVKEFTPQKPGRYKFSCWMGMISGVIQVVDGDSAGSEPAQANLEEIPSGASGCGGGGGGGGGCGGDCGGGCGSPNCPYAK